MVTWHPENPITPENEVESDDCEVTVQLLPMRCILDQRAINFIRSFFYSEETEIENSEKWSAGLHYLPPPRFRAFRVKPWKLKVDYLPQVCLSKTRPVSMNIHFLIQIVIMISLETGYWGTSRG